MSMTAIGTIIETDKIAFVVCLSDHEAIGVSLRNEVHYFNYDTKITKLLTMVGINYDFPEGISQVVEIKQSQGSTYIAISEKNYLHVFCVDIFKLTVTLIARANVQMDCICYGGKGKVYIAYRNKVVPVSLENRKLRFGKNIKYSDDSGSSVSTIKYTYL